MDQEEKTPEPTGRAKGGAATAAKMTPEQKAIYAELSAKVAAQPALLREMDAPH